MRIGSMCNRFGHDIVAAVFLYLAPLTLESELEAIRYAVSWSNHADDIGTKRVMRTFGVSRSRYPGKRRKRCTL